MSEKVIIITSNEVFNQAISVVNLSMKSYGQEFVKQLSKSVVLNFPAKQLKYNIA